MVSKYSLPLPTCCTVILALSLPHVLLLETTLIVSIYSFPSPYTSFTVLKITPIAIIINKYSLLSPYLMYSTENNTDSKYSLLSPYLMYSTENNTDIASTPCALLTSCTVLKITLIVLSTPSLGLPISCTVLKTTVTLIVSTPSLGLSISCSTEKTL